MRHVLLTGWTPGLNKVSLTKLLKEKAGLDLKTAKDCTDRLLRGEVVQISVASLAIAEALVGEATELGATATVENVAHVG